MSMDMDTIFASLDDHLTVLRYLLSKSCVTRDSSGLNSTLLNVPFFEYLFDKN